MSEPFRFKLESFKNKEDLYLEDKMYLEAFVDIANKLLDEHVASLPEVFGIMLDDNHATDFGYIDFKSRTHRAKLWGVEQLKKEKE